MKIRTGTLKSKGRPSGTRKRTICEVCREIYRIGFEIGDIAVMAKAQEAELMAKKMQARLVYYKGLHESDILDSPRGGPSATVRLARNKLGKGDPKGC